METQPLKHRVACPTLIPTFSHQGRRSKSTRCVANTTPFPLPLWERARVRGRRSRLNTELPAPPSSQPSPVQGEGAKAVNAWPAQHHPSANAATTAGPPSPPADPAPPDYDPPRLWHSRRFVPATPDLLPAPVSDQRGFPPTRHKSAHPRRTTGYKFPES